MTSEVVATHVTKRGASFSEAEQVSLTHSWIEVSLNPIHGNDQKGADFYKRVSDIYKVKMGRDYTVRSFILSAILLSSEDESLSIVNGNLFMLIIPLKI